MSGPRPALGALVACGLVCAGCATTASVPANGTLRVALTEYRLVPERVHAVTGTLTILVHNYGRLSHNLVISEDGVAEVQSKPIPPGQGTELFATLSPGRYQMASAIVDDQALGEYGSLTVTR